MAFLIESTRIGPRLLWTGVGANCINMVDLASSKLKYRYLENISLANN